MMAVWFLILLLAVLAGASAVALGVRAAAPGPGTANGPRWGLLVLPAASVGVLLALAVAVWFGFMAWHMVTGGGFAWMPHMRGFGVQAPSTPVTSDASAVTVRMTGNAFVPSDLSIRAGTTVTWVNDDPVPHSATARDGSWDTGLFGRGESRSLTFSRPGEWAYYCLIHPWMTAVIRVAG
ncbi:Plastocyanin [bacterium HR29]|jgi:plastocyanin|nr:Plastocyanin [bacterium HR29]